MPKKTKSDPVLLGPGGVPIRPMPPDFDFSNSTFVIQGAPKVGKSSTVAALGPVAKKLGIDNINPFFIHTEAGTSGIEVLGTSEVCKCKGKKGCDKCGGLGVVRKIVTTVEETREWLEWTTQHEDINPVVIDTGDALFQHVADDVCCAMGVPDPTQSDHGTAWVRIKDTMRELLSIPTEAQKGLIITMHVISVDRRVRGGGIVSTATYGISGKTKPYIDGLADAILHMTVDPCGEEDKHMLLSTPRAGVEAGCRYAEMFPDELDLGDSPETGAEAILRCFYEV